MQFLPRIVAIEVTNRCNLNCIHCRLGYKEQQELDFSTVKRILDEIKELNDKVIIILTGGEPLLNKDIYKMIEYSSSLGFITTLATNGTLIDLDTARKLKNSGLKRISISIDSLKKHDWIRNMNGALNQILKGIENIKNVGLEFQINTTVSKLNYKELDDIYDFSIKIGAKELHLFFLVPTGRGKEIYYESLDAKEYEEVINWIYEKLKTGNLFIKPTCVPHFYRVLYSREPIKAKSRFVRFTRGCLAGLSYCLVTVNLDVQPCGYFPISAGNLKRNSFKEIWFNSEVFRTLRDFNNLKGKCGICEFKMVCGGCRARALALRNDYLEEEPFCIYKPSKA